MLLRCGIKVSESCPAYQVTCRDSLFILAHVLRVMELTILDYIVVSAWLTESVSATSRLHPTHLLENYWIFLLITLQNVEALLEHTELKWD